MSGYVLTFGETMGLAINTRAGAIATSREATLSFGGAESNVAIALARLGTDVTWCSRLGTDPFGPLIERELRAEGVTVRAAIDVDHPTGFMLKERRSSAVASVAYWRAGSAASFLSPDDIPDELIANSSLVHVTGIMPALSAGARHTSLDVVARARALGVPVSVDINHRERLWAAATAADTYRELVAASTLAFASDHEAQIVVGDGDPVELAERLAALGPREVVIKLGAAGCVGMIDGVVHVVPAVPIDVVDPVGAGDAFVGAYLAEWLDGVSPEQRLVTAATAGAIACTTSGDWESSPTRHDLERFARAEGVTR